MITIREKKYYIIAGLLCTLIILQIIDFPPFWPQTLILAILKFGFGIAAIILTFFVKKWYYKLLTAILCLVIIYLSFVIPLWKITANCYLEDKESEFINIYKIIEKDSAFVIIMDNANNEKLNFNGNYFDRTPPYSSKEIQTLKSFIKKNHSVELWKDDYGLAFIFDRFIDNRRGILYCPSSNNCKIIDETYFQHKIYRKIREHWYYYGAG